MDIRQIVLGLLQGPAGIGLSKGFQAIYESQTGVGRWLRCQNNLVTNALSWAFVALGAWALYGVAVFWHVLDAPAGIEALSMALVSYAAVAITAAQGTHQVVKDLRVAAYAEYQRDMAQFLQDS